MSDIIKLAVGIVPMKTLKRRQFLGLLAGTFIAASLSALSGCQRFQPKPFVTGRTITPPQGCTELLQRDQRGYC